MTKKQKAATMVDVANVAGVSPMTVSRAFKRDASVSNSTREAVLRAADQLGFVLDSTAASLSSRKTGFIAVTIPSINNANFADTVRGLTERLRESELQILLGYTDYDTGEEERLLEQLLRRRPEAIVVTGGVHTQRCRRLLEGSGVPVVETWDLPEKPVGNVVGFSNADAAKLMVDHFVDRGYGRIGFIGGDVSRDTRGLDRWRGFAEALQETGLDDARHVPSGTPPVTMRKGAVSMGELIEKWPDTQAVMCVSDLSAFGALTECQRRGIRVPGDIAIAGFGAYDVSEISVPSITTIDVDATGIGEQAAEIVLEALAETTDDEAPVIRKITPKLIVRETT